MRENTKFLRAIAVLSCLATLPLWLFWAGSYSLLRDASGIVSCSVALLLMANKLLHRRGRSLIFMILKPSFAIVWLMTCWFTLGLMDRLFAPASVPLRGNITHPNGMMPDLASKHIALALSGGGYRAALVHAGVVMQLSDLGVPASHLSSVSGGSIIGAFLASGGDPVDFIDAVRDGRFRLKRELTSAMELPFWLNPLSSYSRRDVQAGMLRRVLLPEYIKPRQGPRLIIAMTDLAHVMSVGMADNGVLFVGPTTSQFFRSGKGIAANSIGDLAELAAVSGAFPGAFPAKNVLVQLNHLDSGDVNDKQHLSLQLVLADGGVRDNLGLRLLEKMDAHARGTAPTALGFEHLTPGSEWALDAIIVSDGGAAMEARTDLGSAVSQVFRAVDVASLETGIVRLIDHSQGPPKRFLSLFSLVSPYPDSVLVLHSRTTQSDNSYDFFRPGFFDQETLRRIVDLVPDNGAAKRALKEYFSLGTVTVNVQNVKNRCHDGQVVASNPECIWWRLVRSVGADIEAVSNTFRMSDTLRDDYTAEEVDDLVRLGRYFVLLDWPKLKACLAAVAGNASDAKLTCLL